MSLESLQKRKEYQKVWREKNRSVVNNYSKLFRQKNPEKAKQSYKKWRLKNLAILSIKERHSKMKRNYGISPEEYENMFLKQNGVCVICLKVEKAKDRNGIIRNLAIDHNHKTGKVRGLLCSNCNVAIGFLKEDVSLIKNVLNYLNNE